ncbi:MAG: hypothetical protein H0T69_00645 [Thermoleophilaceae bacterium]|nr:hypothetical protein [Thermoleophilaceae bacterium]
MDEPSGRVERIEVQEEVPLVTGQQKRLTTPFGVGDRAVILDPPPGGSVLQLDCAELRRTRAPGGLGLGANTIPFPPAVQCDATVAESGPLTVDEDLFLEAVNVLSTLDRRGDRLDPASAAREFMQNPVIDAHYENATGTAPDSQSLGLAAALMDTICRPQDPDSLGTYLDRRRSIEQAAADFVRTAVWSFLAAWTQRYGAFMQTSPRDGVVDPNRESS